jgi:hypothetical protein
MYNAFADKLIEVTEHHAVDISKQWCNAVRTNPRTPTYHKMSAEACFPRAVDFYKNLRRIYFSERPYTEVQQYFSTYAEQAYKESIPLSEAIYALIMMRRHMWLYADFQAIFVTGPDHQQAVESITKTIRLFDHGTYLVARKYEELNQKSTG